MKKVAIGCLVILLAGVVLFGVGAYFLYRAAAPMVENARNALPDLREAEKGILNQTEFTPPANGELTTAQVDRFVKVQERVRASLGVRFQEIEAKYKSLKREGNQPPPMRDVLSALSEIPALFTQARRYQVEALNEQNFSQSEYDWVRARVYQAAGVEFTGVNVRRIEEALREGFGRDTVNVPAPDFKQVPARNRELVKPHFRKVDDWLPLAFFGL